MGMSNTSPWSVADLRCTSNDLVRYLSVSRAACQSDFDLGVFTLPHKKYAVHGVFEGRPAVQVFVSHLPFKQWATAFRDDQVLTAALLDSPLHQTCTNHWRDCDR